MYLDNDSSQSPSCSSPLFPKAVEDEEGEMEEDVQVAQKNKKRRGVEFVLPSVLAEKVSCGLLDQHRVGDFIKSMAEHEYKAIVRSTPLPRGWAEKLQMYPSATTHFAFAKNRYRDVLANEEMRVKLVGMEQDYINASILDAADMPGGACLSYIACQAPLPSTLEDFWWMVWQEKCCVIVMLSKFREKGVQKAHPYWPQETDGEMRFGPTLCVSLMNQRTLLGICISTLCVTKKGIGVMEPSTRVIYHLFYTEWPDFGVPRSTKSIRNLIAYINLYLEVSASQGPVGPVVCHCSAGIGRTGAFIATHIGTSLLDANMSPDVAGIVKAMRERRSGMVQTGPQYAFVYAALNDHINKYVEVKKPQRFPSGSCLATVSHSAPFRSASVSSIPKEDTESDDDDIKD